MKYCCFLIITALLSSCRHEHVKITPGPNDLVFNTDDITTGALLVQTAITGDVLNGELSARIRLSNSDSKAMELQEVSISPAGGARSAPEGGRIPFSLNPGQDSTLNLKFHTINNVMLYHMTGLPGNLKPAYLISITYKLNGSDTPSTVILKTQMGKGSYLNYTRKYKKRITGYSFNTSTNFNERQKKYLVKLNQAGQPPFVYLSEQEIAVSGLNFRLKGYYLQDTLRAELFIVNHSEFPIKIIPEAFDIVATENEAETGTKTIHLEKISGSRQDPSMIEKGDRILIRFKKHMKINDPGKKRLLIHLHNAFMLTGRKPLFNEDLELLPIEF